jgi:hypothetical protein
MRALIVAALFLLPSLVHAGNLSTKQLRQRIEQKVNRIGKVSIRGSSWTLRVANGPFINGARGLELKAKGTVNRSTGAVRITYNNPAAGAAL